MINFFKNLSLDIKGIIYISIASLFFALMSAFVKLSSSNLNLIEIIFLRSLLATIILLPFIYIFKIKTKTTLYSNHLMRAVIGISAMLLNFYAVSKLPLSNFIIISFAKIFFFSTFSFFFFKRKDKNYVFFLYFYRFHRSYFNTRL